MGADGACESGFAAWGDEGKPGSSFPSGVDKEDVEMEFVHGWDLGHCSAASFPLSMVRFGAVARSS